MEAWFEVLPRYLCVVTEEKLSDDTRFQGLDLNASLLAHAAVMPPSYVILVSLNLPRQNTRDTGLERHNLDRSQRVLGWQRVVSTEIDASYSSRQSRNYIKSLLQGL
jgi:hypothetical protein